ncbi:MAG: PilN domain-containing protein [Pseudomonadota bacterium]
MGVVNSVNDFKTWWLETIAAMFRRGSTPAPQQAPLSIKLTGQSNYTVTALSSDDTLVSENASELQSLGDALRQLNRKASNRERNCTIQIPRNRFFVKQLAPIKLPPSQFEKMAALDLISSTPMNAEDVHLYQIRDNNAGSTYAAVKKSIFDPVVEACRRNGLNVSGVMFEDAFGSAHGWIAPRGLAEINKPRGLSHAVQQVSKLLAVLVVLGTVGTYGHIKWRHIEATRILDKELQQATAQAGEVRALIAQRRQAVERIVAIRAEKTDAVPLTLIVEELSKILPDNAWLTDLELDGDTVRISGFTASASSLVSVLENSPYFEAPTFRNPVLRVSAEIGERFTISMKLEARSA